MNLLSSLAPELVLIAVACVLFFFGISHNPAVRRASALIAFVTLAAIFVWQLWDFLAYFHDPKRADVIDEWKTVHITSFVTFVKMMVAGVGALLMLLAWPTNRDGTGSASLNFGNDAGEFFALALLSLAGVMLVASSNDIILLFLGIELAAIPTYIMVSISRPLPVAQEAGVKYFFLGAMAAAVMLFGFSYLYGATGHTKLDNIAAAVNNLRNAGHWSGQNADMWLLLGVVVLLAGFAFKIVAVPFHAYAADVYQGAATPVTALLAFVPKTSGFVAIIKILSAVGGSEWVVPETVVTVLQVVAIFTMTVGNVLGLLQLNVKRVFAYSSIAHSGYMLVAVTALVAAAGQTTGIDADRIQANAIQGVLFYLLAYGIMNTGAFGILMLLPSRAHRTLGNEGGDRPPVATTAETFEDLAGQGRAHPYLGLGMAICCFSLIGLPLTVGFFGKIYLIAPAWQANLKWLVILTMLNAAISAAYYLRIVATMFIRPAPVDVTMAAEGEAEAVPAVEPQPAHGFPLTAGVTLAVFGTLVLGIDLPFTDAITKRLTIAGPTVAVSAPAPATQPTTQPVIIVTEAGK